EGNKAVIPEKYSQHPLSKTINTGLYLHCNGFLFFRNDMDYVGSRILEDVRDFIIKYSHHTNQKLSSIYRFYGYGRCCTDSMYAVWKYMQTCDKSDDRHIKNIMNILEFIKERETA